MSLRSWLGRVSERESKQLPIMDDHNEFSEENPMAMSREVWEPGMKNGRASAAHPGHAESVFPKGKSDDGDGREPGATAPAEMKPGRPGAPKPNRPGAPKPGRPGEAEPDPSGSPSPGPARAQHLARFEGMRLKLRKTAAGRYALGVDIELGVDAKPGRPKPGGSKPGGSKPGQPKPGRPDDDTSMQDEEEALAAGDEGEDEGERAFAEGDDDDEGEAAFAAEGDDDEAAFAADDEGEAAFAGDEGEAVEDDDDDEGEAAFAGDDDAVSLAAEDDAEDDTEAAAFAAEDDEGSLAADDDDEAHFAADDEGEAEGGGRHRWPNRFPVREGVLEISQAPALFSAEDDDEDEDEDDDDDDDEDEGATGSPVAARSAAVSPLAAKAVPGKPVPGKPVPGRPAPGKPAPGKASPAAAVKKMLAAAKKTIGMGEHPPGSDHNKITQWYSKHIVPIGDGAWCNMAVTYWAGHSGNLAAILGGKKVGYALTTAHAQKFKQKGRWRTGVAGIKPGDIVFFDWGGSRSMHLIDHVGVVEKVKGKKIVTIEGNTRGNRCRRMVRDAKYIVGYGRPFYGK